jgi:hypothetical protein
MIGEDTAAYIRRSSRPQVCTFTNALGTQCDQPVQPMYSILHCREDNMDETGSHSNPLVVVSSSYFGEASFLFLGDSLGNTMWQAAGRRSRVSRFRDLFSFVWLLGRAVVFVAS